MAVSFRNLDVTPDAPVAEWGVEGVLAAVDRGDLSDWSRIAAAVADDPRGEVADLVLEALDLAEDSGAAAALRRHLELAVERADERDRRAVADELASLWRASGLDQATYAHRLGTSRTRFSSYVNGRTVPLATVLVRARRLAMRSRSGR